MLKLPLGFIIKVYIIAELEKLLGLHELLSPIALSVSSGTLSSIDNIPDKSMASSSSSSIAATKNSDQSPIKSWHIQPTCAITGEGELRIFHLQIIVQLVTCILFQVFTRDWTLYMI